jgi:hypothetical protein
MAIKEIGTARVGQKVESQRVGHPSSSSRIKTNQDCHSKIMKKITII